MRSLKQLEKMASLKVNLWKIFIERSIGQAETGSESGDASPPVSHGHFVFVRLPFHAKFENLRNMRSTHGSRKMREIKLNFSYHVAHFSYLLL